MNDHLEEKQAWNATKFLAVIAIIALPILLSGCATQPDHPIALKIDNDMVLVEGGEFTMGSDDPTAAKSERPAHTVKLDSFYLSKFEVTQELFESVMGSSMSFFPDPKIPVNNLSWQQATTLLRSSTSLQAKTIAYRLRRNGSSQPKVATYPKASLMQVQTILMTLLGMLVMQTTKLTLWAKNSPTNLVFMT
ncbi:uncharacterized conserved protein [Vibrio variabilis]|uniref:Uncharacterized conserved protein n=1 Tax=Vibrio variabilis TaxID=990271 RepID=A0ABQ0JQ54_9VIBR|nr:uncharacterized conserved protein [Vibrio variabilis]